MSHNRTDYTKKFNHEKVEDIVDENFTPVEETNEIEQAVEETIEEPKMKEGRVSIGSNQSLNVRSDCNTDAQVVAALTDGRPVVINEICGDWYRITTETGVEGYAMAQYIDFVI